jgi:imidazolonepropionase-like amidohydrolase
MPSILAATLLLPLITQSQADKASGPTIAYRGAKILTASGATFSPGTLVVQNGKIQTVGAQDQVTIPEGSKVIDVSGKVIIPGLVDTHSHIGLFGRPSTPGGSDGNESSGPVQSIGRAVDAVNPLDPGFRMATAGGITTANIMPGSGNAIGGQTIYIKLRGNTIDEMRIQSAKVVGGLKWLTARTPSAPTQPRTKHRSHA